jgi:heat shock protein HtpX
MRRLALQQALQNRVKTAALLLAFLGVWLTIGALLGYIVAGASGSLTGATLLGIVALLACAYGYLRGEATVLRISHAEPADPQRFAQLHRAVEKLAARAGLPKPSVYVIQDPAPNAFATGRNPKHAAVTVTTGLLDVMSDEELDGVLGHEISHIKHRDILLLLIVSTVIGAALLLAGWAWQAAARVDPDREGGQRAVIILALAGAVLYGLGLVLGPLIQLALSRSRESLADQNGVQLAEDPTGLISALTKLEGSTRVPVAFNHATAGMFIDNPLEHHRHWLSGLFDTHPPIELRIADLQRTAGLPVTAFGLHERIESELRQEDALQRARAKATGTEDLSGGVQVLSLLAGLVLTVVVLIYQLWLWYFCTFAVLIVSAGLGEWLATEVLIIRQVWEPWFVAGFIVAGLSVEVALYLTGLWIWALALIAALLVGGFLILCFGHETVAFLNRRRAKATLHGDPR